MKEFFTSRPFAKIGLLAIPMIIFMLIMEKLFPKVSPEGFQSFIIAFEFAKTPDQLHNMFSGFNTPDFNNLDIGNHYDFGFMLSYCLFLFLLFRKAALIFRQKWLLIGAVLSVIILLADFSENLALLKLTRIYSPTLPDNELIPLLYRLHMITWIKWGGLAICFALYSIKLLGKKLLLTIEGVALILPAIFSIWALTGSPQGISKFTLSITLAFALLILYCFHFKERSTESENAAFI